MLFTDTKIISDVIKNVILQIINQELAVFARSNLSKKMTYVDIVLKVRIQTKSKDNTPEVEVIYVCCFCCLPIRHEGTFITNSTKLTRNQPKATETARGIEFLRITNQHQNEKHLTMFRTENNNNVSKNNKFSKEDTKKHHRTMEKRYV